MAAVTGSPLWRPDQARADATHLARFLHHLGQPDYAHLHRWSIERPELFWREVWERCGVVGDPGDVVFAAGEDMPSSRFFPHAHLNVAENLLDGWEGDEPAIIAHDETGNRRELSGRDLRRQVAALGGRAARRRRRPRRPRGRVAAQRARSGRHDAGRGIDRGDVLLVLSRLRCRRGPRPLRPDRAGRARRRRRVPLQRPADRLPGTAAGDPVGAALGAEDDRRARPVPRARARRHRRRRAVARGPRPSRRSDAGHGPAALRPSVVRALLVRHHRAAEVHRPPDGWGAAQARGRAPAPVRRPAGRPCPLLHDDGLDDVELAGLGAGLRRHRRAVRRLAVRARA